MANWNREKVASLDTDALGKLRANALRMCAAEVLAWCDEELATRRVKAPRSGRTARPDDERNAEAEAAAKLTEFARGLLAKYDLSSETAKGLSKDVKGFRSLELLGKNAAAKVGGLQLNGALSLERYISYRLRDDKVVLGYLLIKERPVEDARWVAVGPRRLLPNADLIVDQLEGLRDVPNAYVGDFGLVTNDFDLAAEAFENILAHFAISRSESGMKGVD